MIDIRNKEREIIATLAEADLRGANLRWADLRGADLRGADLDFSAFPLWCGSFQIKADERLIWQLIAHIKRFNTTHIKDKKALDALKALEPYKNKFCNYNKEVCKI
uniref:Pentapeptide repeat-containing protein n=1 Tax=viral metagenome TaxID=1070528 RepID=A0A6M3L404_9ZZZZ